jgi:hypothetical protein
MEAVRKELKSLLGREPTCSLLKDGQFLADYYAYRAPATKFVAKTEDEALKALLEYLKSKPKTLTGK